jgi:glycosyltransferase involved in cell wall biosynthesis
MTALATSLAESAATEQMGDRDLIFVSLEPWDAVWRRNQFLCAELARRRPERQILFVEPPVDVSAAIRRRQPKELLGAGQRSVPGFDNITVTRPRKWLPNKTAATRQCNAARFRRHVYRAAHRLGFYRGGRHPLLWLNPYDAVHMIGRMHEAGVIYDITDDWTCFGEDGPLRRRIAAMDQRMSEQADAIIVCSNGLQQNKAAYQNKLHLIQNGVDCEHYARVWEQAPSASPGDGRRWDTPVLGYTGTVHADRLDVDLLMQLARRMERGTIVLIGPNHLSQPQQQRLEDTGRVVFAGVVPYHDLPDWMSQFDVCIVPHRVTPFTESLNPIKLWEYLASGKPIVATPVAGFRDYADHVRLASDPSSFLSEVRAALWADPAAARERQALAQQHSWHKRVDAVEAVLNQVISGERCADR